LSLADLYAALPSVIKNRRELRPLAYLGGEEAAREAYVQNLARNLALFESARAILDEAEARGVALLPLKGLALAEPLYGDVAARPMSDLDIAVRPEELARACDMLPHLGWRRLFPERARYSPRHGHDVAFTDEAGHVLELHYRLYHELGADAEVAPLFERSLSVELLGRARRIPSWDDHFFLVAVHAATHAFGESASWIVDLALLAERASVERAAAEAERRGAGLAFRSALRTAHRALGRVPSPPGDVAREQLLDLILGDRLARPPRQLQSLLARAVLTERPSVALREILRKLELRVVELAERRR
jgi:Uncharacterised nucleotidyltransferase